MISSAPTLHCYCPAGPYLLSPPPPKTHYFHYPEPQPTSWQNHSPSIYIIYTLTASFPYITGRAVMYAKEAVKVFKMLRLLTICVLVLCGDFGELPTIQASFMAA